MSDFFVHGVPVPKGSAKALQGLPIGKPCNLCRQARRGHPRVFSDNSHLKGWEQTIRGSARASGAEVVSGCVEVTLDFHMPRIGSHYRTGQYSHILKEGAPHWHTVKPDLDKLERAVLDGLTNIGFADDATVVVLRGQKFYSTTPGVQISIREAIPCALKTPQGKLFQPEPQAPLGTRELEEST